MSTFVHQKGIFNKINKNSKRREKLLITVKIVEETSTDSV